MSCAGRSLAAVLLATMVATSGCEAGDRSARDEVLAPRGVTPGRRLPWPEASSPVTNWSFATDEEEIALETAGAHGRHSVIVWCVVVDGKLYVATDGHGRKRWVVQLGRDPAARVGIRSVTYPVRARPVREQREWDAVMAAYARKYGDQLSRYEFPRAGDLESGRVFELATRG